MNRRSDCDQCETEGLARVMACRDVLDFILWGEVDPVQGVDSAITGLRIARRGFVAAGFGGES